MGHHVLHRLLANFVGTSSTWRCPAIATVATQKLSNPYANALVKATFRLY